MGREYPPVFNPPPDLDIAVWRYMDVAKFVDLLSTRSLFFCRADLLGDPYEGSMSRGTTTPIIDQLAEKDQGNTDHLASIPEVREAYRRWAYVSCWHMNEDESAAMWSLYARTNEAVAIRSTYRKLRDGFPDQVYTGTINYIDYRTQPIPQDDLDYALVHKRLAFQHEREVRAVITNPPHEDGDDAAARRGRIMEENPKYGKHVPIDLNTLVDRVYVSPTAPAWFAKVIESLVNQYAFTFEVHPSTLAESPHYGE